MCFSPGASFVSAALLTGIGLATLRKTEHAKEWPLAFIPLFFAIQQGLEGTLWLALMEGRTDMFPVYLGHAYGVFVGIIWPVLVPLSLYLIEPWPKTRWLLLAFLAAGLGLAAYAAHIIFQHGISAIMGPSCIVYENPVLVSWWTIGAYALVTCGPFLVSDARGSTLIGVLNLVALGASYYFYESNMASVWCFFAALISAGVFFHFHKTPLMPEQDYWD